MYRETFFMYDNTKLLFMVTCIYYFMTKIVFQKRCLLVTFYLVVIQMLIPLSFEVCCNCPKCVMLRAQFCI